MFIRRYICTITMDHVTGRVHRKVTRPQLTFRIQTHEIQQTGDALQQRKQA
jgi:hypothetical protein